MMNNDPGPENPALSYPWKGLNSVFCNIVLTKAPLREDDRLQLK